MLKRLHRIKSWIKTSTQEAKSEPKDSSNRIYSQGVAECVLAGGHIEIMSESSVSADSRIGGYSYIGKRVTITRSVIGRYVSIADNVTIGAGEHLIGKVSTSAFFYEKPYEVLTQKDCHLGNDVWIGVDSIVRRGVRVGDGAIVGANSTVTRDIPDYAIVVGSPARILKYRFTEADMELIRNSRWWDYELEQAKVIISELEAKLLSGKHIGV